jgi:hypothetical protein
MATITAEEAAKLSDAELLEKYNAKTGGIPMTVVKEVQKRKLVKFTNKEVNSNNMYDL